MTAEQRRLNRVRNKNSRIPSFDVVAHWIVNGRWFNILVKVMLFVNAIIVGIDVEVYQYAPDRHPKVQLGVDIVSMIGKLQYCSLYYFSIAIAKYLYRPDKA